MLKEYLGGCLVVNVGLLQERLYYKCCIKTMCEFFEATPIFDRFSRELLALPVNQPVFEII